MKAKRRAEFWERVIAEVRSEGAPQRAVAAKYGVSMAALKYHLYKAPGAQGKAELVAPALLPVQVQSERIRQIDIEVGRIHLHFEEGCDPRYVAALLSELAR